MIPDRSAHIVAVVAAAVLVGSVALSFRESSRKVEHPGSKSPRQTPPAIALPPRQGPSPVRFVDVSAESGVDFQHVNGFGQEGWYYVEVLGSGVVFFDADGDGDCDLFFCNGTWLVTPRDPAPRCAYYRNDGAGRFVDATEESGLGDRRYANGACAADYDNDGDLDLCVANFDDVNTLYRNDGRGRFTDVAAAAGVTGAPDGVHPVCAFADVDGDGWLDLYIGGCVDHTRTKNKVSWDSPVGNLDVSLRRYSNPVDYEPLPDFLYRNRGDGTFEDVSRPSGIGGLRGRTLGLAFCDFDDDGDQDLFVANDRSPNHLLVNDGRGRFTDVAEAAGVALDAGGRALAGMGVTAGDWDGDGRIDVAATYFEREANGIYRNEGELLFTDRAQPSGTANPSFLPLGWGTELFDADLDGRLDWLVVNGHVQPNIVALRAAGTHVGYEQLPLFFANRGGGLFESLGEQAGPALAERHTARGLATADFDGDGDLDVAINNNHARATIWRNDSPRAGNHWLRVKTIGAMRAGGAGSNRDGIGARIVAHLGEQRLVREVHSAQSYFSQSDLRAHFGLGGATCVDLLEIRWPSGRISRLEKVAADQVIEVVEPETPTPMSRSR